MHTIITANIACTNLGIKYNERRLSEICGTILSSTSASTAARWPFL